MQLSRIGSDGNEVIVGFIITNGLITTNDTFENNLFGSLVAYRAIALSDVDLQYFSQQNIADSPSLAKSLLVSFGDRLTKAQQLSTILLINNKKERLREPLLILKEEIGIPTNVLAKYQSINSSKTVFCYLYKHFLLSKIKEVHFT